MAHKFGDVVVLVKKSPGGDGKTVLSRVNAFVLAASVMTPRGADRQPIKVRGVAVPDEECLDMVFMEPSMGAAGLKVWNLEVICRFAYAQRPFTDELWQGWEEYTLSPAADEKANEPVLDLDGAAEENGKVGLLPGPDTDDDAAKGKDNSGPVPGPDGEA